MDPKSNLKASDDEAAKKYMEKLDQILATDSEEEEGSDIECEPCSKIFSSVLMYEQHLNSKKHYKMLSKLKTMQKLGSDVPKKKSTDEPQNSDDSSEELYCDVCDKEMSGYKNYMAHMKGNIHAKNLKQLKLKEKVKGMKEFEHDAVDEDEDGTLQIPFARCSTCCKTFYGPESYQQHLKGANHKKKLRQMKVIESLKKDEDASENGMDVDGIYKCEVCNKSFSGPVPYKVHLMSSVHQKELHRGETENELKDLFEKNEDSDKLVCKECKKAFPDPFSFKSHIANNSHGKQKVKDTLFGFVAANPEIVAVKSVQNVSEDEEEEEELDDKENFRNGQYFLVCKLCHTSFSGPESARDHLESKKHMKNKMEKAQKKALKDKQNGRPAKDQGTSATVGPENGQKRSSAYREKTDQASNSKPKNALDVQDDFEML